MLLIFFAPLLGVLIEPSTATSTSSRKCRAAPFTPDWPTPSTWASFNTTLSGQLIKPHLAASVCYQDRSEFDAEKCRQVLALWATQEFHTKDPISLQTNQWTDWSCLPLDLDVQGEPDEVKVEEQPAEASMPIPGSEEEAFKFELRSEHGRECSGRGYPAYVVNATTVLHIQAAVNFARANNVRLSIKNTGHDVPGRSIAPGSLSIWTHHLNSVEYHEGSFTLAGSGKTVDGDFVTAGSGCQNYKVQMVAREHGRVFTGGGSKTVGMGGFITGGGHSILSPHFGLAADNVLQVEVVTPNGEILVANEDQNADLFWALRGGGGSTFGVVTSLVLRLHEDKPLERVLLFGVTEPNSETAYELVPWGISKTPYLMDNGVSGYMFASHSVKSPIPIPGAAGDPKPAGGFMATAMIWDPKEDGAAQKVAQPLMDEAKERWGDKVQVFLDVQRYESFMDWYEVHHDKGPAGLSGYIVSRLFDRTTLEDEDTVRRITEPAMAPSWGLGAYMVAGKGVHEAEVPGGANAVHPAWRDAMILAMTWKQFPEYDREAGQEAIRLLDEGWQPIREHMPKSGSYVNEGLTEEKNWQDSFWGANYEKLLAIKREIDPTDVFWCKPCVGHDRWVEVETNAGRQLCRAE